jgi:hypothetical protein
MRPWGIPLLLLCMAAPLAAAGTVGARPAERTVCTITVNSPDEGNAFRKYLPEGHYRFVELVERGRPDWLASACARHVSCDVLVISGHFNGRTDFFSDEPHHREYLPVAEMERVSCSDACPIFSRLKEVYLFGCNTLNPNAIKEVGPEVARSLVHAGRSPAEAQRIARLLDVRHGESSRDRMRRIFLNVPTLYGFSAMAPLGSIAAVKLDRFFRNGGAGDVASGRPSPRLLGSFSGTSFTVATGMRPTEPGMDYRKEVCEFVDDRVSAAEKLRFVHALLRRNTAEARLFLDRIEALFASLDPAERDSPEFAAAHDEIAFDDQARTRYLQFAQDADDPAVRARMIVVAGKLGWFSESEVRDETLRMIDDLLASPRMGPGEVELICLLGRERGMADEHGRYTLSPALAGRTPQLAGMACLGDPDARKRVLDALTDNNEEAVKSAEVYFTHYPVTDVAELRDLAEDAVLMSSPAAQVHAIETLGRHHVKDVQTLETVVRLFSLTRSLDVQRAVADLLLRADYGAVAKPELAQMLAATRLPSTSKDSIDVLIRALQAPVDRSLLWGPPQAFQGD